MRGKDWLYKIFVMVWAIALLSPATGWGVRLPIPKEPEPGTFEAVRRVATAGGGNTEAQNEIGDMFFIGKGVPQNDARAANWYRMAAERGHVKAQAQLGFLYSIGRGVPPNLAQSLKWYRKAAEQGDPHAQLQTGYMYLHGGKGVPPDPVQAYMWFTLVGKAGPTDEAALQMTKEQISEAQRLATEWSEKHR